MKIVKPTAISGFPEWLPAGKILENKLIDIVRSAYERFGFVPIETPAIEMCEVLKAKGGKDKEKEIYGIRRVPTRRETQERQTLIAQITEDLRNGKGVRFPDDDNFEWAMHFDLTVPLARYVAQHQNELVFPFRRYQIQKVWRGERPQAGRFREFYQCDIDVIGDGELSLMTDAEIPSIIYSIFKEMKIGRFVIIINNKKILLGLCQHFGIPDDVTDDVLDIIDKMEKIGTGRVLQEISEVCKLSVEKIQEFIDLISTDCGNSEIISKLESMEINETFRTGVEELSFVFKNIKAFGVPDRYLSIDLRIARGLDYYTGTVYETVLTDHRGVGSICSGGRYENLASYFTDRKLPGVGISIGMTRMLSRLIEAKILEVGSATIAPVLITTMDQTRLADYIQLAAKIRKAGINAEVFLEPLSLKAQLKYANRKKFAFAIIAGETEFADNKFAIKNLHTGEQQTDTIEKIISLIKDAGEILLDGSHA